MSDLVRLYEMDSAITANNVCQIINDGKIKDLPLLTPHDDVYGTTVTMTDALQLPDNFNNRMMLDALKLSDGRFLLNYLYSSTLYCIYVTISGTTMTIGITMTLALDTGTNQIKLYYVADNRLMLSYCCYQSSTYYQRISAILISADNIMALGTYKELAYYSGLPIIVMNDAKTYIYAFYIVNNNSVYVTTFSLSSITLTQVVASTQVASNTASIYEIKKISDSQVLIMLYYSGDSSFYTQEVNLYNGQINIRDWVKNSITPQTPVVTIWLDNITCMQIYSKYVSGTYYFMVRVLQLVLNSRIPIKLLCETQFTSAVTVFYSDLVKGYKLNSKQVQIVYESYVSTPSYALCYVVLTYDDVNNVVTAGTKVVIYENQVNSIFLLNMTAPVPCPLFYIKNLSPYNMFLRFLTNAITSPKETRLGKALGIASNNAGAVFLKGVYKGFTNLEIGKKYYFNNATGVVSTISNNGTFLGVALNTNELLINETLI